METKEIKQNSSKNENNIKLVKNKNIKGYKGRYKVIDYNDKQVTISYNGQFPRTYEILFDKNNNAYFLHNGRTKIIIG